MLLLVMLVSSQSFGGLFILLIHVKYVYETHA